MDWFRKKSTLKLSAYVIYGIGKTRIMTLAAEAEAIYKVGNSALINTEIFEEYLEKFREPARPLSKHVWNKVKNKKHQNLLHY